ncbi:hypothetical protein D1007_39141 [Hordeum vulgare]|nr:hypothetical protein D1007_39141 [Hordeum vulgare]
MSNNIECKGHPESCLMYHGGVRTGDDVCGCEDGREECCAEAVDIEARNDHEGGATAGIMEEEEEKMANGWRRMFQPNKYPGLDEFYEQKHRAVLVERGEVPPVLRLRGHNPNESLLYDPRTNRQTSKSVINWEEHHMIWVDMWNAQRHARVENDQTPDTDEAAYLRHLEWMHTEYRVIHKAAWTRSDCLDLLPSGAADATFNNSIRETVGAHLDYGPLHDRVGTKPWRCINDSNVALGRAPSSQTDGFVRTTLQKVANRCRTLAALLSCHGVSSTDVRARAQYTMDVQSSARLSASRPRASSARPSSSRARAYSSRAHVEEFEEEEEESDNEAADPDFIEFGAS